MSKTFYLALTLVLASSLVPAAEPFTLQALAKIKGEDRPTGFVWSPDSSKLLYRQSKAVWLLDKKTLESKKIFEDQELKKFAGAVPEPEQFDWQNRRVRPEALQWFPDNQRLLVYADGDIFLYDLASTKIDQLTKTAAVEADPKLSPDGEQVAYRLNNELWVMEIATKKSRQLTKDATATRWNGRLDWVYPEELDLGTAYWWSPDSSRIAYLQFETSREFSYMHTDLTKPRNVAEPQRYPHAGTLNADVKIGILDVKKAKTKWVLTVDGLKDVVARVDWTPDSKHVAAIRQNRVQDHLDLVLIDAKSGQSGVILSEASKSWVNVTDDYQWLENGELLWSSEKTGFRHFELYGYTSPTSPAVLKNTLTSGKWMVTSLVGVDPKNRQVYYTSTERGPLDRALYRVKLDGTGKEWISRDKGMNNAVLSPDGSMYVYLFSGLDVAPHVQLLSADRKVQKDLWASQSKVKDEYLIPATEIHQFTDAEGNLFYGRMIKPVNFDERKKYPALVVVYGGPHAQTVTNNWVTPNWEHVLANQGFVIWQMDNRGSYNRGLAWESALYRRFGKVELEDQLKGVDYLAKLGFVDMQRLGIYGWSYGGYMTTYAATRSPDTFKAAAAGAPVTDWHFYDTIYTERYLGTPESNEENYKLGSAASDVKNLKARFLLIHCYEDDNVVFQNSMHLIDELQKAGKPFQIMLYPDKAHGTARRQHLAEQLVTFFGEQLNAVQ